MEYRFEFGFFVRDYECDLQGVVNNAVYLNYLEHARHEILRQAGVDFAELHIEGVDPVVVRAELDYRRPLQSGDRFAVRTSAFRQGRLRLVFVQDIYRLPDNELILNGKVIAAVLRNGRPDMPDHAIKDLDSIVSPGAPP